MGVVIHLATFRTEDMERASWLCAASSKAHGVETHARYHSTNIQRDEVKQIRWDERGAGYWAWKPLIILKELNWLPEGSTLIYSDAGVEFIAPVSHVIERMDQDVFLFGNNWEHAHWCKRDVIEAVWPMSAFDRWSGGYDKTEFHNHTWQRFGKQCQASVIFFRVSDYSRTFVAEWLKWCLFEGGRLIDDSPSRLPNHPEFREHRHDQAILTTLAYREGIPLHWWPSVYNKGGSPEFVYEKLPCYSGDNYPVLFSHNRKRNHEFEK